MIRPRIPFLRSSLLVSLAMVTGACTIATDEQARPVEDTSQLTTTTQTPAEPAPEESSNWVLPLYFYNDEDGLVRVARPSDEKPIVQDILDALASAPNPEELETSPGIATRFLPEMQPQAEGSISEEGVLSVRVQGSELREFGETNPDRVQSIYTQIVCSMSATSVISLVQILDDDGAIRVQGSDGAVLERAIGSADVENECLTALEVAALAAEEAADADAESRNDSAG